MRSDPAPEITVEGDLSDEAVEALADLLIALVEADSDQLSRAVPASNGCERTAHQQEE